MVVDDGYVEYLRANCEYKEAAVPRTQIQMRADFTLRYEWKGSDHRCCIGWENGRLRDRISLIKIHKNWSLEVSCM